MAEPHGGWTLADLLQRVRARLEEAGIPAPALDARLLVEHFTETSRADWISEPRRPVDDMKAKIAMAAADRRAGGEPVHRIIGFREFYGLRLALSPGTLEPRPDTETLVDLALPFVRDTAARHGRSLVLDLGTGTGAIALALLKEEAAAHATGADFSRDALATADGNADMNGVGDRFSTVRSDWYSGIQGHFHIIVSNPPYIKTGEMASLQREVREHDPYGALDGGVDGLEAYRIIAGGASRHLIEDGRVVVEIGAGQRADVERIFVAAGLELCATACDLARHERALMFGSA